MRVPTQSIGTERLGKPQPETLGLRSSALVDRNTNTQHVTRNTKSCNYHPDYCSIPLNKTHGIHRQ